MHILHMHLTSPFPPLRLANLLKDGNFSSISAAAENPETQHIQVRCVQSHIINQDKIVLAHCPTQGPHRTSRRMKTLLNTSEIPTAQCLFAESCVYRIYLPYNTTTQAMATLVEFICCGQRSSIVDALALWKTIFFARWLSVRSRGAIILVFKFVATAVPILVVRWLCAKVSSRSLIRRRTRWRNLVCTHPCVNNCTNMDGCAFCTST